MARRSQEKLSRGNRRGMVVIAGVVAVLLECLWSRAVRSL